MDEPMLMTHETQEASLPTPSENLAIASSGVPHAVGDDVPDMEAIYVDYLSRLRTQPLPRRCMSIDWLGIAGTLISLAMIVTGLVGIGWVIATTPTITITLVPIEQARSLTTPLAVPLRPLVPVRLTRSLSTPTTGTGHQDARTASGTLTLYNGTLSPVSLAAGTIVTGHDGVQVVIEQAVPIPAASPPSFGQATVPGQAVRSGARGNIAAGDIDGACCGNAGVVVKNLTPFRGGQDARVYQAVAQWDLDAAAAQLRATLSQQVNRAFALRHGEAVYVTSEEFTMTAYQQVGEEARMVTIRVTLVGRGVAYTTQTLLTQATYVLQAQISPGSQYHLLAATVQTSILSVSPLRVTCRGWWVSILTETELVSDAQQIAGKSAQQAQVLLLQTGLFTQVSVPQALPTDPAHIQFRVLVSQELTTALGKGGV